MHGGRREQGLGPFEPDVCSGSKFDMEVLVKAFCMHLISEIHLSYLHSPKTKKQQFEQTATQLIIAAERLFSGGFLGGMRLNLTKTNTTILFRMNYPAMGPLAWWR